MNDALMRRLIHVAQPQEGCVSTAQLRAAGIADDQITRLAKSGLLASVCHGVYALGAEQLTDAALLRAATIRGGRGARLAEQTALAFLGLTDPDPERVVIWTPRTATTTSTTVRLRTRLSTMRTGRVAVIELRARRRLHAAEIVRELPVSGVVDALIGHAARGHSASLSRAWREADFKGMLFGDAVEARLGRGIEGSRVIRELMDRHPIVGADVTLLSRAERRLLGGITRRGLGRPAVNQRIECKGRGIRPDFFFPDERLAVEVLGGGHDSPARQREDADRTRLMRACGIDVLEVGDVEVWRDLERCLDLIAERLSARRFELHLRP